MRKMDILPSVVAVLLVGSLAYVSLWIGKKVSYVFMYESMVIESIQEKVKPSCLY